MTRMVECVKLKKMAEGLERQPYPGELGQRVFETISKEAWQLWMQQQTILINENRLSLAEPKSREFLEEQMVKFLFEDGGTQVNFTP